jgi:hypothetical protein
MLFRRLGSVVAALLLSTILSSRNMYNQKSLDQAKFGTVHFPTSCSASVQKEFERGVALLHSFAFETAEETFRQVAKDDPRCAMAHWGIARSFWRWSDPDANIREQGWREALLASSLEPPTRREKEYIAAVSALYQEPQSEDKHRWDRYVEQMQLLQRTIPMMTKRQLFMPMH